VYEATSSVVHHTDYLNGSTDQPLCGATFEMPPRLDPAIHPAAVCPDCEAKLPEYHVIWWRERAEAAIAELDELRVKYRELTGDASPEDHGEIEPVPPSDPAGVQDETTPTSLLDQARRELLELCRRSDETVPYWRVKNTTDAFSDKLKSDERLLLAQEIGADGNFIRWCIREIEGLGVQVTDSPVHGDASDMMDAWADLYPPPKKTKWRLGRS
jgi:hypothetical protein